MSRTNHHTPYRQWNVTEAYQRRWALRWNEGAEATDRPVGHEIWDLRFYAGCKRQPQKIHKKVDTLGKYCNKLFLGQGVVHRYTDQHRGQTRIAERAYETAVRQAWNAGADADDVPEPFHMIARHSIEWELW